jgi:hypothetical protein
MILNDSVHAAKLEEFLHTELKTQPLPIELPDKTVIYKSLKIKQRKTNTWQIQSGNTILANDFKLRVCAVLAADCYLAHNYNKLSYIKSLDSTYWRNEISKVEIIQKLKEISDPFKRDVLLAKYSVVSSRAALSRQTITQLFSQLFDK